MDGIIGCGQDKAIIHFIVEVTDRTYMYVQYWKVSDSKYII